MLGNEVRELEPRQLIRRSSVSEQHPGVGYDYDTIHVWCVVSTQKEFDLTHALCCFNAAMCSLDTEEEFNTGFVLFQHIGCVDMTIQIPFNTCHVLFQHKVCQFDIARSN